MHIYTYALLIGIYEPQLVSLVKTRGLLRQARHKYTYKCPSITERTSHRKLIGSPLYNLCCAIATKFRSLVLSIHWDKVPPNSFHNQLR